MEQRKLVVYLSAECMAQHVQLCRTLLRVAASPTNSWTFLQDEDGFLARVGRVKDKSRFVALLSNAQISLPQLAIVAKRWSMRDAVTNLAIRDPQRCCNNLCGS